MDKVPQEISAVDAEIRTAESTLSDLKQKKRELEREKESVRTEYRTKEKELSNYTDKLRTLSRNLDAARKALK